MSSRKRIGLMVPSTNTTCEADFQMMVPRGITVHGQRLWMTNEGLGDDGMNRMNAEIESGARYLATARVDVILYGCTTGSFFKGPGLGPGDVGLIERAAGRARGGHEPLGGGGAPRLRRAADLGGHAVSGVEQPAASRLSRGPGLRGAERRGRARGRPRGQPGHQRPGPRRRWWSSPRGCAGPRPTRSSARAPRGARSRRSRPSSGASDKPVVTSNQASIWATLRTARRDPARRGIRAAARAPRRARRRLSRSPSLAERAPPTRSGQARPAPSLSS